MELRRHYHTPADWEPLRNVRRADGTLINPNRAPGALLNAPPFSHVEINDTGATARQHFTPRLVARGQEEGWIVIQDGTLTIYAQPDNLVYTIRRVPGRYSCFDGAKLPDDDTGAQARAVIAATHPGEISPDPNHPAGYECINYYECELNPEQHERFRFRYDSQKGVV